MFRGSLSTMFPSFLPSYQYPNLSEGADRVGGQLRGDKECPFSGVTKSGRVLEEPESDARRVVELWSVTPSHTPIIVFWHLPPNSARTHVTPLWSFSAFWLRSKCSICSYQLNIWYAPYMGASILNRFLNLGEVSGACSAFATGWPGIAVPPRSAHSPLGENNITMED